MPFVARFAVLGLVLALSACSTTARRADRDPIPLAPYVGRLVTVEARMAGVPLRLLVDTGAGLTALTPAAAARVGCVPAGRSTGWRMSGERIDFPLCRGATLELGHAALPLAQFGIFDLARVLPAELPPVDGILGLDAFASVAVTFELGDRRLWLDSSAAASRRDASWVQVPSRIASGADGASRIVFLGVAAPNGATRWLELDSGNLDVVRLSPEAAQALEAASTTPRVTLRIGSLDVGPLDAAVHDLVVDGALNAAFFERYDVRIDAGSSGVSLRLH